MKVRITFTVGDEERDAIGHRLGDERADYEQVRSWIENEVDATLEGLVFDEQRGRDEESER